MYASTRPGKEATREYLVQRLRERTPPPPQSEVRRRLGWTPGEPAESSGVIAARRRKALESQ
jgi:hypothetical protein